jgi:apolipoprotein N-acyltransferase
MSNDSWFAETPGARLHLVVSAFRSIETRRPQVRVTNSGISAVIGRDGELLATTRVGERTALIGRVAPVAEASTLMLRWGDWPGPTAFVGGLAALALSGGVRRRRRSPPAPIERRDSRTC